MKNISPARVAAFEILNKIELFGSFSSALLPQYEESLEPKDRGLCHELTLGVLRRKLFLDKIIREFTKKNIEKFDIEVLTALRIGLYQLIFLDRIPDYSAINDSVNLTKLAKKKSASGLVNAVLRKASKATSFNFHYADEIERIATETSHPVWLIKRWIDQFGIVKAESIASANNEAPKSTFRFTAKHYKKGIAGQKAVLNMFDVDSLNSAKFAEGSYNLEKTSEFVKNLADSGEIYFQEEGSQLIGEYVNLRAGESFFDVCAAPGSKATNIALKLGTDSKSLFVAGDFYDHRLSSLQQSCLNQGAEEIKFVRYDAEKQLPFADQIFDVVLVDAPCSGTGTIRSNPEIRYSLTKKDLIELPAKQLEILKNASKLVKSGGRIVYSTCSLETEENEQVIEKFLALDLGFEKSAISAIEAFLTGRGFVRTFPDRDGIDGFFVAVLSRI